MEERKHHELSFSKWPAWAMCPLFDGEGETEATQAGTAKHIDFEESIAEMNTGVPALHSTDGARWAASVLKDMAGDAEIHSETRVEVSDTGAEYMKGIFGYCDAWFIKDGRLCVADYKSGARGDADHIPQVAGYAFAILSSVTGMFVVDDTIDLVVLYGASHDVVHEEYSSSQVAELSKKIVEARLAKEGSTPSPCWACRYCAHKLECPSVQGIVTRFQRSELSDMSDAKRYYVLSALKGAIECELERIKRDFAESGASALSDSEYRYELRSDSRGRAVKVHVGALCSELSERGVAVPLGEVEDNCLITKANFLACVKAAAKDAGMKVKELEEIYAKHTEYGQPAVKMVLVSNGNNGR